MAAQKLFGDFPAGVSAMPGMVTPNITADVMTRMDPQTQARMWQLEDRAEAKREARNAQIRAEHAARQQAAGQAQNEARLRAAFDQMYGPQLQRSYHDRKVLSEGVPGTGVPGRGYRPEVNRLSSGNMNPDVANYTPPGGWYKMGQNQLNSTLDQMWRAQTDPYLKAVSGMGAPFRATMAGGTVGGSNPYSWAKINQ
jgi:hypothetical protein